MDARVQAAEALRQEGRAAAPAGEPDLRGLGRRWLRQALGEPLVGFVAGGSLLFAAHAWLAAPAPSAAIVVDARWAEAIAAEAARGRGRAATAAEVAGAIAAAVEEERLYREGLARGLDQGDPIVRRRVIQKARFVLEDEGAAVDEAGLAAWLAANAALYATPTLTAITQVFVDAGRRGEAAAEAEARRLLAALKAGAGAEGLGDPSPHGARLGLRAEAGLAGLFGDEFAAAVGALEVGRWGLVRSRFGWHAVRVEAREAGRVPALGELHGRVAADAAAAGRAEALAAGLAALRERYPLVVVGVDAAVAAALEGR